MLWTTIVDEVGDIAKEFIEDKDKKNELDNRLALKREEARQSEHKERLAQIKASAEGARPFLMRLFGVALVFPIFAKYGVYLITAAYSILGFDLPDLPPVPEVDVALIGALLSAILGYGTARTFEKVKGIATTTKEKSP